MSRNILTFVLSMFIFCGFAQENDDLYFTKNDRKAITITVEKKTVHIPEKWLKRYSSIEIKNDSAYLKREKTPLEKLKSKAVSLGISLRERSLFSLRHDLNFLHDYSWFMMTQPYSFYQRFYNMNFMFRYGWSSPLDLYLNRMFAFDSWSMWDRGWYDPFHWYRPYRNYHHSYNNIVQTVDFGYKNNNSDNDVLRGPRISRDVGNITRDNFIDDGRKFRGGSNIEDQGGVNIERPPIEGRKNRNGISSANAFSKIRNFVENFNPVNGDGRRNQYSEVYNTSRYGGAPVANNPVSNNGGNRGFSQGSSFNNVTSRGSYSTPPTSNNSTTSNSSGAVSGGKSGGSSRGNNN